MTSPSRQYLNFNSAEHIISPRDQKQREKIGFAGEEKENKNRSRLAPIFRHMWLTFKRVLWILINCYSGSSLSSHLIRLRESHFRKLFQFFGPLKFEKKVRVCVVLMSFPSCFPSTSLLGLFLLGQGHKKLTQNKIWLLKHMSEEISVGIVQGLAGPL